MSIKIKAVYAISRFILIILFGASVTYGVAGDLDTGFTSSVYGTTNGNVFVTRLQVDGKLLVGGQFTEINGFAASGIARLNVDGSVDTSFNTPDFYNGSGIGATVYAIELQQDGKILVGGFILGAGDLTPGIRRLNPNGAVDNTFAVLELHPAIGSTTVFDIKVQSDGKILLGGFFGAITSTSTDNLIRLNFDGTRDPSFASSNLTGITIKEIAIMPDGKIIVGGFGNSGSPTTFPIIKKFNADGTVDSTFTETSSGVGTIEAVRLLPDGKLLVGGNFSLLNGFQQGGISKINSDGTMDLTFNQNNSGANGAVNDIALNPDGRILIGGIFTTYNTTSRQKVAYLNADGTLNTTLNNNTVFTSTTVNDVEILPGGKLTVGINFTATSVDSLHRLNQDGTSDLTFTGKFTRIAIVRKILPQTDGKILIGGFFPIINGVTRKSFARLNSDGSPDAGFVPYFNNLPALPNVTAIAVQSDAKVLVGTIGGPVLKRLNSDGSQDTGFDPAITGTVFDIAVLSNGQILVAGNFTVNGSSKFFARFNANGTLDSAFAVNQPNSDVQKIVVQPGGNILIAGEFTQIGVSGRAHIARLLATDGALDASFNPPGGANAVVYDVELQQDGKIILAGAFTSLAGNNNVQKIGRLNSDGTLDTSFIQVTNGDLFAVKVQSNGKILIGGSLNAVNGILRNGIARLNANGSIDEAFNPIPNTSVVDIGLQSDEKIIIGGEFTKVNQTSSVRLARLLNPVTPTRALFDYDGDRKSDISVFRASENKWYILQSSNFALVQTVFAVAGDIPIPADYDGDGKTDVAIFRPSAGQWWYQSSINGAQVSVGWGQAGDIPRPSDFDGDGKTDFIVYRPSNSVWYRFGSTGVTSIFEFGTAGDKPLIADFDGDGKSDVAIFRPSTGDWWYSSTLEGGQFHVVHWGASGDIPVAGDYDADGKTDFVVYRPSSGGWYILRSGEQNYTILPFGTAEDKPVAADYDGDGKADIGLYRPSAGTWYLLQTNAGFGAIQFGISSDIPTENAFVPLN